MNRVTRWEYNAAALKASQASDLTILDSLGKEGWELCGVVNDTIRTAYFKRPIYPKPPATRPPIKKRKYKE